MVQYYLIISMLDNHVNSNQGTERKSDNTMDIDVDVDADAVCW